MPVIGFNFDKLLVEKKNPPKQNIKIKNDINVKGVKQEEVAIGNKKESILRFDFEFSSEYQPNVADIKIGGHILYTDTAQELKKIFENWKKTKKLAPDLMLNLFNIILVKCNIKALSLSQDLNLPPHIRLPTINPKVNTRDYIG